MSIISYEHQSARNSLRQGFQHQTSLNQNKYAQQMFSPQPRRQLIQDRAHRSMNLRGYSQSQMQSSPIRQISIKQQRDLMYQKARPGRLNLQQVGRNGRTSVMNLLPNQLQSPMMSGRGTPNSARMIPLSPMTIDGRAKHSKVIQKLIQEQSTQKKKAKKEKFRKKNTLLKNAGAFLKGNSKNKSFQFVTKHENETSDKQDEEDVELEVFKQYLEANQQEPSKGVFSPDSVYKSSWDLIMLMWIVWQAVYIPFVLCFEENSDNSDDSSDYIEYFMDISFAIDILLNFNTGFFKNGVLIMNRKLIMIAYFKSWFILDLVSSVPYSEIFMWSAKIVPTVNSDDEQNKKAGSLLRLFRILRFLRFLKLLRVLKLSNLKSKYEDLIYNDTVNVLSGILKILIIIIFFTHTFACLFWLIGYQSTQTQSVSWVIKAGLLDSDVITQYITSMYWAFTTLVSLGYGDISALNTQERMICMVAMIVFSWVYALTLSQISKMVLQYNQAAGLFKENMFYVQKWMKYHDLNPDLRNQIRRFLEYQWDLREQMKIEEDDVMKLLNQDLREKITLYTNVKQLRNLSFCSQFTMEFLGDLAFSMETLTFSVGENIILEKEEGDKLFFITSGKVCVLHRKTHTYLDDLSIDDYFGEIGFFTEQARTTSVKARDFTNIIYLDRTSFLSLAENNSVHESMMGVYYKIQNALMNEDFSYLNIRCFICRNPDHIAIDCGQFKLQRGNLHKIFNKQYMDHSKKGSSNSLSERPRDADFGFDTQEQMEMRDVALLIDADENRDKFQVNTIDSNPNSSLQSQELLKYLYEQAGYIVQKDSFATEESQSENIHRNNQNSVDGDSNDASDHENPVGSQLSKSPSPRGRMGFPQFYKLVNLDNNKSIKKSQLGSIKQLAILQKNRVYSSSSESSEESKFSSQKRKKEEMISPSKDSPDYKISSFYPVQQANSNQTMKDEILDDSDISEKQENFKIEFAEKNENEGNIIKQDSQSYNNKNEDDYDYEEQNQVETIQEVDEYEEETPSVYRKMQIRNTLRLQYQGRKSTFGSNESQSQSAFPQIQQPIDTLKKNSRKMSSGFLSLVKADQRKAISKKQSKKNVLIRTLEIPKDNRRRRISNPTIQPIKLNYTLTKEPSIQESKVDNNSHSFNFTINDIEKQQATLRSLSLDSPQKQSISNLHLQHFKSVSSSADSNNLRNSESVLSKEQQQEQSPTQELISHPQNFVKNKTGYFNQGKALQQIQELEDEFDIIQEESSSISNTTIFNNRLSSVNEKKSQITDEQFLVMKSNDINNENNEIEFDDDPDFNPTNYQEEAQFSQSLTNQSQNTNDKQRRKTITDSMSFKTSQDRIQYFNQLEIEMMQELQEVFNLADENDLDMMENIIQDIEDEDAQIEQNYQNSIDEVKQSEQDEIMNKTINLNQNKMNVEDFTSEEMQFFEQMEQKIQGVDIMAKIDEIMNKIDIRKLQNIQINIDSLEVHDYNQIIGQNSSKFKQKQQNQSDYDSEFGVPDCKLDLVENKQVNSLDINIENLVIREYEKQILNSSIQMPNMQ